MVNDERRRIEVQGFHGTRVDEAFPAIMDRHTLR